MYEWENKYSVGIQSIDSQHKEIFKFMNNLLVAMKEGKASKLTLQIILELEKYALVHFQKEEFFFNRFNYSGTAEHIEEHHIFIRKVAELKSDLNSGKITLTFELLNFLKDWIDHHILEVDMKYSECFRQNGLK